MNELKNLEGELLAFYDDKEVFDIFGEMSIGCYKDGEIADFDGTALAFYGNGVVEVWSPDGNVPYFYYGNGEITDLNGFTIGEYDGDDDGAAAAMFFVLDAEDEEEELLRMQEEEEEQRRLEEEEEEQRRLEEEEEEQRRLLEEEMEEAEEGGWL